MAAPGDGGDGMDIGMPPPPPPQLHELDPVSPLVLSPVSVTCQKLPSPL